MTRTLHSLTHTVPDGSHETENIYPTGWPWYQQHYAAVLATATLADLDPPVPSPDVVAPERAATIWPKVARSRPDCSHEGPLALLPRGKTPAQAPRRPKTR